MASQNAFNLKFAPGLFAGITAADWLRLPGTIHFRVSPCYVLPCLSATAASLGNSINRRVERWKYERRYMAEPILRPLFILGHWRSGTTHLHNLLARDDRFAYPNLYQVL